MHDTAIADYRGTPITEPLRTDWPKAKISRFATEPGYWDLGRQPKPWTFDRWVNAYERAHYNTRCGYDFLNRAPPEEAARIRKTGWLLYAQIGLMRNRGRELLDLAQRPPM